MLEEQKEVSVGWGSKLTPLCCSEYLMDNLHRTMEYLLFSRVQFFTTVHISIIHSYFFFFQGYLHWFNGYRLHKHCLNILLSNTIGSVKGVCRNLCGDIKDSCNILLCFYIKGKREKEIGLFIFINITFMKYCEVLYEVSTCFYCYFY